MPNQMPPEPNNPPKAVAGLPNKPPLDPDGALFHLSCAIHNLQEAEAMLTHQGHRFWIKSAVKDINQIRGHISKGKR